MKILLAGLSLLLPLVAVRGAEVVLENWDVDNEEWTARLSRDGEQPGLIRYDLGTGSLEVKVPKQQVTITKKDLRLPDQAVKITLEVTPLGKDFKELEVNMVIYSAGKALDVLGRAKLSPGTEPAKQTVEFPVNVVQHLGSSWNKFAIRIYCDADLKVRIDNLKAVLRE